MDDYSDVRCTSCEVFYPYIDFIIETICLECCIKANRCQLCTTKLPWADGSESAEKLVEGLLKDVRELRLEGLRLHREQKITSVLFEILRKQIMVSSFYSVHYTFLVHAFTSRHPAELP